MTGAGQGNDGTDPSLLVLDMHRSLDHEALPDRRTVVALDFPDAPTDLRRWWLLIDPARRDAADVRHTDPGVEPDVYLRSPLATLVAFWRGDIGWEQVIGASGVNLFGRRRLCRDLPTWFARGRITPATTPTG